MGKALQVTKMALGLLGNLYPVKETASAFASLRMEVNMKESGSKIKCKEEEFSNIKTVESILETLRKTRSMAEEK